MFVAQKSRISAIVIGALVAIVVCLLGNARGAVAAPAPSPPVAGTYTLDQPHASLLFRVRHLGFSHFTGRLSHFNANLTFDPANPERSHVAAVIDPLSLASDNPPAHFMDMLHGPDWLNAAKFATIRFRSTRVERTGPAAAHITGDLTLHGVTRPVVLDATFNGGYGGNIYDPHARVGFSAHGTFKRPQFGITAGLPPPGTNFGVGDDVEVIIEAEFNGPAWKQPARVDRK